MNYTYEIARDGLRYAVIQHGRKARKMYVSPTRDNCEDYIARRQCADAYKQRKANHDQRGD